MFGKLLADIFCKLGESFNLIKHDIYKYNYNKYENPMSADWNRIGEDIRKAIDKKE